ncbi:MAG: hypothetical protein J6D30_01490 [Clostridia bacterium]|nr:hypothetical protein [Clostridia bacterium]
MGVFDHFVYKNGEIVDNSWVKWFHWGVPDEEGKEREEARKRLKGLGHCSPCTVLSGCYFVKSKLPEKLAEGDGLLHPYCDCSLKGILNPIIKAYCAIGKFSGYVFSDKYAENGKKALFESFGYTIEDSEWLKAEYERQAKQKYLNGDYIVRGLDPQYGQDINMVIELTTPMGRNVQFISGWKVHPLGLITCNTPLADD